MIYAFSAIVALAIIALPLTVGAATSALLRQDAAHRAERAELLQRIQAPDTAVAQHVADQADEVKPAYVGFDNDEEYFAAKADGN